MLTFRGGGWVLALTGAISLALMTWALLPAIMRGKAPPAAESPDDYGFDLSALTVPKSDLVAALPYVDFLPRWDNPPLVPDEAIGEQIRFGREKYLVSTDRVIGVMIGETARAYPISLLNVHEIINDTLADTPIAVTYNLWCDSVAVFDRHLAGKVIELGSSGMVLDSNSVLCERADDRKSASLFLQLSGQPIAGPAAERRESLSLIPASLLTWAEWHEMHPETSVVGWDEALTKRYEGSNPDQYFQAKKLAFDVDPLPPTDSLDFKERIIAITINGQRRVYPMAYLALHVNAENTFSDTLGSTPIEIQYDPIHRCAWLRTPEPVGDVQVNYALWFAWFALHGDADVVGLDEIRSAQPDAESS